MIHFSEWKNTCCLEVYFGWSICREEIQIKGSGSENINEFLAWLLLFAKYVCDKPPNESTNVFPYQQIKSIQEEYVEYINSADGLFGTPAANTYICDIFYKITISHNIRLLRNTESFVICTICTAYHSRLQNMTSEQERKQLKLYRRAHLDKQHLQREK